MALDIEDRLLDQLRSIEAEHRSRMASINPQDPLAVNAAARTCAMTLTLLRNLRSTVPIGSPIIDAIEIAERELPPAR